MPKPISAADFVPTLLAMVMIDRRRALMGDGAIAPDAPRDPQAGPGHRPHRAASRRAAERSGEPAGEARA
jgi:hypothetical protein